MLQWEQPTNQDKLVVSEQIGRHPRGMIGVAARCRYGRPQVIVSHPLYVNGKVASDLDVCDDDQKVTVFPTLYWLTCSFLQEWIGRLESSGWIYKIKKEMRNDTRSQKELYAAHRRTAQQRRALLSALTLQKLQAHYPGQYNVLTETGVAGMRYQDESDDFGIKCLHAHFADYLVHGDNPVGRRVVGLLAAHGVDVRGQNRCQNRCTPCCGSDPELEHNTSVIDIGSNSVRLLIGKKRNAQWEKKHFSLVTTRLAEDTTPGAPLREKAMERTLHGITAMREKAETYNVSHVYAVATSAVREATNKEHFLERVWEQCGVSARLISGEEEAAYAFRGALAHLNIPDKQSVLFIDIGGGSTEIAVGTVRDGIQYVASVPWGAVRLYHASADAGDWAKREAELKKAFVECVQQCEKQGHIQSTTKLMPVAVGGTATTLAAMDQQLTKYEVEKINGYTLAIQAVQRWYERIQGTTREQRMEIAGLPAERADIMPFGLLLLLEVYRAFQGYIGYDFTISDNDLMLGVLYEHSG